MKIARLVLPSLLVSASTHAQPCPKTITDAVARAFPAAAITSCASTTANGLPEWRVHLEAPDHASRELDLSADGHILAVAEDVAPTVVPHGVLRAFHRQFPHAAPTRVQRRESARGVTYEIVFMDRGEPRHVTFKASGPAARSR